MEVARLSRILCFSALSLSAWMSTANAEVYRYVKDGQVFYGDRMPSSNHQSGHSVLNKQGVVFKEVLSRDEQRQVANAKKEVERLESRDRALLDTFGNEDDLVLARNRRLTLLDIQIGQIDSRAESLCTRAIEIKNRIKMQEAEASDSELRGGLHTELNQARAKLNSTLIVLNKKMIERNNMASQFVADMNRFRELKAQQ